MPGAHRKSSSGAATFIVAAVLVVLLIAAAVFATFQTVHTNKLAASPNGEWQPYVDAAATAGQNLTTIDYRNVDRDIQRVLDMSTGTFHDEFQSRAATFKKTVLKSKSVSTGMVAGAGVQSLGDGSARVLVAVTVRTSNAGAPEQEPRSWRMRIDISQTADGYKASNVEFVP